jgi:hypothetical protein
MLMPRSRDVVAAELRNLRDEETKLIAALSEAKVKRLELVDELKIIKSAVITLRAQNENLLCAISTRRRR